MKFVWKLRAFLFSIPVIAIATIVMALISIVCSLWDQDGNTQHAIARVWSRILLAVGFVRCKVAGVEKLDPAQSYVLVSNHASYIDTPAVVSSIPLQFRFLAKKGLFSIPFLGWHLSRAGHIPVIRGDRERFAQDTWPKERELMRERGCPCCCSLRVAVRKNARPFKEGAAYFAIKGGVPVVPIGLVRTREACPCTRS